MIPPYTLYITSNFISNIFLLTIHNLYIFTYLSTSTYLSYLFKYIYLACLSIFYLYILPLYQSFFSFYLSSTYLFFLFLSFTYLSSIYLSSTNLSCLSIYLLLIYPTFLYFFNLISSLSIYLFFLSINLLLIYFALFSIFYLSILPFFLSLTYLSLLSI